MLIVPKERRCEPYKVLTFVSGEAAINDIALTSSGYGLFSAAGDKVRIWDLRKFHSIGKLSGGHQVVIQIQLRRMCKIIFGICAYNPGLFFAQFLGGNLRQVASISLSFPQNLEFFL